LSLLEDSVLALARLILTIVVAVIGVYLASRAVDRFTREIHEWDEIRRGNIAVSVFMTGVLISAGILLAPAVGRLVEGLTPTTPSWQFNRSAATALVQLVLSFIVTIVVLYVGIGTFSKLTRGIDEWAELRRGNTAVGLTMAGILIVVSYIVVKAIELILPIVARLPL